MRDALRACGAQAPATQAYADKACGVTQAGGAAHGVTTWLQLQGRRSICKAASQARAPAVPANISNRSAGRKQHTHSMHCTSMHTSRHAARTCRQPRQVAGDLGVCDGGHAHAQAHNQHRSRDPRGRLPAIVQVVNGQHRGRNCRWAQQQAGLAGEAGEQAGGCGTGDSLRGSRQPRHKQAHGPPRQRAPPRPHCAVHNAAGGRRQWATPWPRLQSW